MTVLIESAREVVKPVPVETEPGSASVTTAEVRAWCEVNLAGYRRPRVVVEFRPALPPSAVGQVLWRELRDAP